MVLVSRARFIFRAARSWLIGRVWRIVWNGRVSRMAHELWILYSAPQLGHLNTFSGTVPTGHGACVLDEECGFKDNCHSYKTDANIEELWINCCTIVCDFSFSDRFEEVDFDLESNCVCEAFRICEHKTQVPATPYFDFTIPCASDSIRLWTRRRPIVYTPVIAVLSSISESFPELCL